MARQMELEREATQSALSEKELVKRSLEAENRLVAALQKEKAASDEATQAERAAKYAAEQEVVAVTQMLRDAKDDIELKESLLQKVGEEVHSLSQDKRDLQADQRQLMMEKLATERDLAGMTKSFEEASAEGEVLKDDLRKSRMSLATQEGLVGELGKEAMSLKEAMREMKAQAMDMALTAQRSADAAAAELAAANGEAQELRAQLEEERRLQR